MGWWETFSDNWQMSLVAQVGGAEGLGGGLFVFQFKSPKLPVKPNFLGIAGGVGAGGSIGSAIAIPYRSLIRQLMNPGELFDSDSIVYSSLDVDEGFSCRSLNHSRILIGQATASAAVVGAQKVIVSGAVTSYFIGTDRHLYDCGLTLPSTLAAVGSAALDTPQMQGGLGLGIFGFAGVLQYIGAS
jgi:hypothetical protein